jgi:hypothetical protein
MSRSKRAKAGKSSSVKAPVYHKTYPQLRVAARGDLWEVQRLSGEGGKRGVPKEKGKPWVNHDPWMPLCRPTTFVIAEAQMYALMPVPA